MRYLIVLVLVLAWVGGTGAWGQQVSVRDRMVATIKAAALTGQVPPLLLVELCARESGLDPFRKGLDSRAWNKPRAARTTHDYSYGLCQVKLETARWVWSRLVPINHRIPPTQIDVSRLDDAVFNSNTAALYLSYLHGRFGDWKLVLAAYNIGPFPCGVNRPACSRLTLRRNTGKGSYAMTVYTRWQRAELGVRFRYALNQDILRQGMAWHRTGR